SFLDLARETLERYQTQAQSDLQGRQKAVEHLVDPIRESLGKVGEQLRLLESVRQDAYVGLRQQMADLTTSQTGLREETQRLSQALRAPNVRGRWGEIQLRRVVEIAGMLPHCDFVEQAQVSGEDGSLRPDLIVLLPGGKTVVVDAKAPLKGYLEAMDAPDEESRRLHMRAHATQLRQHMVKLGAKRYTEQLDSAPEFVVLFLPGESFFSAALEQDPVLIEDGVQNGVILATPTTLIALLRAVSYGWRQETLAEGAQVISQLGREMYERLRTLTTHFDRMGRGLQSAVSSYNRAVGSYQSRVLVTARRFEELGVPSGKEIAALEPIDMAPRSIEDGDSYSDEDEDLEASD
ncbi:MAG: DNA recombination protein RmuC, partial [Thermoanaerobaculia bacterium]|nr:DNA recombination protein RmuC [Thermoanaerobaculia bacterium]